MIFSEHWPADAAYCVYPQILRQHAIDFPSCCLALVYSEASMLCTTHDSKKHSQNLEDVRRSNRSVGSVDSHLGLAYYKGPNVFTRPDLEKVGRSAMTFTRRIQKDIHRLSSSFH